jgi:UDP-N-acetylmuramate--alanine ligase
VIADARRVHFVGIGGAGMSAIAKVLFERGFEVSGSDLKRSRAATMLEAMGVSVHIGHEARLVDGADVVVISSAIPQRNSELVRARKTGVEVMTRGAALAALLNDLKSVVVAGTHGKTSTTSMIVSVLHFGGRDPTYLVGGGLNDVGTNARHGRDELAVAEADESDGSFLLLNPYVAVVTNIEADHLDHWGSFDAIAEGFTSWLGAVNQGGGVVVPVDDEVLRDYVPPPGASVVTFGPGGDVEARDVAPRASGMTFTLVHGDTRAPVALRVPGQHNVANALAAAAACLQVGLSVESIALGLGEYRGVERRFQIRGEIGGVTIIDDYAHHPTEVQATLEAARSGPYKRVIAVFQPHRYSRTQALHEDFGASFKEADRIVITDVYGAGEQPVPGVTGKLISDAVCAHLPGRAVAYLPHHGELVTYLRASTRPGDALLTLGAGDISALGEELLRAVEVST